jgi:phage-related minor tail protein
MRAEERHIVFAPLHSGPCKVIRHSLVVRHKRNQLRLGSVVVRPQRLVFDGSAVVIDGVLRNFWLLTGEDVVRAMVNLNQDVDYASVRLVQQKAADDEAVMTLMRNAYKAAENERQAEHIGFPVFMEY